MVSHRRGTLDPGRWGLAEGYQKISITAISGKPAQNGFFGLLEITGGITYNNVRAQRVLKRRIFTYEK